MAHPFLFAAFPVLFVWTTNIARVPGADVAVSLAGAISLATGALLASFWVVRDWRRAALIASTFIVFFFLYGRVYEAVQGRMLLGFELGRHRVLLLSLGALVLSAAMWVAHSRRRWVTTTGALNLAGVVLVIMPLATLAVGVLRMDRLSGQRHDAVHPAGFHPLRDVYYIILDSYGSSATLASIYGHDNSGFERALRANGFYIAERSRSNYATTVLSLTASLNMNYLDGLAAQEGSRSRALRRANELLRQSAVARLFDSLGYRIINVNSGYEGTRFWPAADSNIVCGSRNRWLSWNTLAGVLVRTSLLRAWEPQLVSVDVRERVLCTFDQLERAARVEGPKFVFAHILAPHPPFIFAPSGEQTDTPQDLSEGNAWVNRDGYVRQVRFVNETMLRLLPVIIGTGSDPIVVIQGDHGPASTGNLRSPDSTLLSERMGILNAYRLPGSGDGALYQTISPVNSFRVVFRVYFGAAEPLLPDRSFYSTKERPWDLKDVSARAAPAMLQPLRAVAAYTPNSLTHSNRGSP